MRKFLIYSIGAKHYIVNLHRANYANGRVALQLMFKNSEGVWEPFMTCSVNLPDQECPPGEAWIKDWSENEGCLAWLIKNKFIEEQPTQKAITGFCIATRHRLLPREE